MAKDSIRNLQKATEDVLKSSSYQEKIVALEKAFQMFSSETTRLEEAYNRLKDQFHDLNLQFEETNVLLRQKNSELDLISYYLNSILSQISQGILFIDLEGMITTYNRSAERILGIRGTKVLFSNFWECFRDDVFGFSVREFLKGDKKKESCQTVYESPNGGSFFLDIDASFVLKDEDGSPVAVQGVIIIIRDMTEMRRLQTIALRNDRMKELGEMAAQVAHEIRNPLGGIKGFASLLQRDLAHNPKLQKMASYIVEGTNNLNRLVTQVLNFVRPIQPHFQKISAFSWLSGIKELVLADPIFGNKKIAFNVHCPTKDLEFYGDPNLLQGVLLNLIVNAIQAIQNHGEISVNVWEEDKYIYTSVRDNGMGIPRENIEKIFSPFFTTKIEGNGFGLAEAHKVIQAHEGTIHVDSIVGQGSVFTLQLPRIGKR